MIIWYIIDTSELALKPIIYQNFNNLKIVIK